MDILPEIGTMKNTNADEAPPKRPPRPKMWKKVSSAGDLRATTASSTAAGTEELQMPGEKPGTYTEAVAVNKLIKVSLLKN